MNDPKKNPAAWLADMKRLGRCVRPGIYVLGNVAALDSMELCKAAHLPVTDGNMKLVAAEAHEYLVEEYDGATVMWTRQAAHGSLN